jgi:hypothetical protein
VQIKNIEETHMEPGYMTPKTIDYAIKMDYNNSHYLWMFGSDNANDEIIFQAFLKSITLNLNTKIISLTCSGEKITQSTYSFCLPKDHTWKRENNLLQLSHINAEDTINITEFSGKAYTNSDAKF